MTYHNNRDHIDTLQRKIDSFGDLDPEVRRKIHYKFRLDWNYYSNSMEGNTLTMDETRSVMVGNITVSGKPIKDVLEIKGHDEVISEILRIGKGDVRLSEARIRDIHKGIMHEEDEEKRKNIGVWKKTPNYIYNHKGERYDFVAPADVPHEMHELLNKTNAAIDAIRQNRKGAPHPIDLALRFHLEFVRIHPFYDGNGRSARILTNLLLISFGYPPFWVKTDERDIYSQYIGDVQSYGGDPDLFFGFIADLILRSQYMTLDAIEGRDISGQEDLDKELALLKSQLSGESVPAAAADARVVCDAMEENLIPMFALIEDKCEGLKEFFFDAGRQFYYEVEGDGDRKQLETNTAWEELKRNWLSQIRAQGVVLRNLRYSYELKGFRKSVSANSFRIDVEVFFNDYNYSIEFGRNRGQATRIPYKKKMDRDALLHLIAPAIKEIIDGIKGINGSD